MKELKPVYSFDGWAPYIVVETAKAICFETPNGHLATRNVWVPKSLMTEVGRVENHDSGELIIQIELPLWFTRQNNF